MVPAQHASSRPRVPNPVYKALSRARHGLVRGVCSFYKVVALCRDGVLRSIYDGRTEYIPGVRVRPLTNTCDGVTPGLFLYSSISAATALRYDISLGCRWCGL